jgi:HK97 family phage major capsid protein
MKIRGKFFNGMTREAAQGLIEREDVREFLARTREVMAEKRSVTGGELGIPEVFLEILRDNLNSYSKLISKINLKAIKGKARQNIAGTIPEGIWTEAYGKINELSITFNQIEVDGYKVGGFIAIPNALLEDSDLGLASEIMYNIGQAIGLAIDKAILYGTGTKMPVGIVKRLSETVQPAYWGDNEKDWTDLHSSNLLLIDPAANTDVLFYKDLILKLGKAKANYSNGGKFWCMNTNTKASLTAKALTINAAGAIVTGQSNTMPIVGGDIVELDFIPDDVIIGGYGSLYLMVVRAGATLAQSTDVRFIEDQTVFKGTARYDGRPVIGEGFIAINISQETGATVPSATAVTFVADTANA